MFKRLKNHIFTLHQKVELLVLYGVIMLFAGMAVNHYFFAPEKVDTEAVLLEQGKIAEEKHEVDEQEPQISELTEEESATTETAVEKPDQDYSEFVHDITVKKGDTFTSILVEAGLGTEEINKIIQALSKVYNTSAINIGQKISIIFRENSAASTGNANENKSGMGELSFVLLKIEEMEREVTVSKNEDGSYIANILNKILTKKHIKISGTVETSLAKLAGDLGVPYNILGQAVRAYSYDVDFQRDIQKGTEFEALYEVYYDDEGNFIREGNIIYSMLGVTKGGLKIYRFSPDGKDDDADFYSESGETVKKTLLKTPINGAIMSSPFGIRKHPISGYTKMHKGVDFAAPTGTPIYAGGDGTIDYIGWYKGYGRYIKIKHTSEYSTAYGHMSGYARGMKKGRKVKQGQVIGYVGSTGISTGPHLHYEILINNNQVNPMKIRNAPGRKLDREGMERFESLKKEVTEMLSETATKSEID